jgi:hypothetical protein
LQVLPPLLLLGVTLLFERLQRGLVLRRRLR